MRILVTIACLLLPLAAQDPAVVAPTITPLPPAVAYDGAGETVLSPRISQITKLHNTMPHKLTGLGIVTGIVNGSSDRGTRLAMLNMVRRLGLNLTPQDVIGGSTALVMVNCELPPFAKEGARIDVDVQSITDAASLRGGYLQTTELVGVDNKTYVVASGFLNVAGFIAKGTNASASKNESRSGTLVNGGSVIRDNPSSYYSESGAIELRLNNPSPFNAMSVGNGVKRALEGSPAKVQVVDMSLVRIELPEEDRTEENANQLVAFVGGVRVAVENPKKVTIDQVSGTILAGEGVLISPCVVGVSEITVKITNDELVSQPNPFSDGTTERVTRSDVAVEQTSSELQMLGSSGRATVAELLQTLRATGMTTPQLIAVFVALEKAGFLHAELEVHG